MFGDPYWMVVLGIVAMIAILVWARDRYKCPFNEVEFGNLYMLYFFGAHSTNDVCNEVDAGFGGIPYYARSIYRAFQRLEIMGLVEKDNPIIFGISQFRMTLSVRFEIVYSMTDEGEAAYKRWASKFGYQYYNEPDRSDYLVERGGLK